MSVEVRKQAYSSLPPSFLLSLGPLLSPPRHWLPSLVECLNVLRSVIKVFLFSPPLPLALCVCEKVCVASTYKPSSQSSKPSVSLSSFSLSCTLPGSLASSSHLLGGTHTHTQSCAHMHNVHAHWCLFNMTHLTFPALLISEPSYLLCRKKYLLHTCICWVCMCVLLLQADG